MVLALFVRHAGGMSLCPASVGSTEPDGIRTVSDAIWTASHLRRLTAFFVWFTVVATGSPVGALLLHHGCGESAFLQMVKYHKGQVRNYDSIAPETADNAGLWPAQSSLAMLGEIA